MTLSRRRFLTVSAAFACAPAMAQAHNWQGRAFGADVSLTLNGPRDVTVPAIAEARRLITQVEKLFSVYDPASALSQLNDAAHLRHPDAQFSKLMQAADTAHTVTEGLFDPTVQPLWKARAEGRDPTPAMDLIGWGKVHFNATEITLAQSQALTFNGIAQGFATDLITDALTTHGLTNMLVNIGEYRGTGGPWKLGLHDPVHGTLGHQTITTGAIATSSPAATPLGDTGHILHPTAKPRWSTVTVEAPSATLADSLSTAMVLAPRDQINAIKDATDVTRITLVDFNGDLITL